MNSGEVVKLEQLRIIYRAGTVSHGGLDFDYLIQDWIWVYLHKYPDLIKDGKVTEGNPFNYDSF